MLKLYKTIYTKDIKIYRQIFQKTKDKTNGFEHQNYKNSSYKNIYNNYFLLFIY